MGVFRVESKVDNYVIEVTVTGRYASQVAARALQIAEDAARELGDA